MVVVYFLRSIYFLGGYLAFLLFWRLEVRARGVVVVGLGLRFCDKEYRRVLGK